MFSQRSLFVTIILVINAAIFIQEVAGQRLNINDKDSIKVKQELTKKVDKGKGNPFLTIHAKITTEYLYSSSVLQYQKIPSTYLRTIIDPSIEIKGIKFNSSNIITSEDIINGRKINMFNISFDQKALLERLERVAEKNKTVKKMDSLSKIRNSFQVQCGKLIQKRNNSSYQNDVKKAKEFNEKATSDSLYAKRKYLKLRERKKVAIDFENEGAQLDSLQIKISRIDQELRVLKVVSEFDLENLNDISNNKTKIDKFPIDKNQSKYTEKKDSIKNIKTPGVPKLLKNVSSLGFFDVYPNYSPLIINGVSLRGAQLEIRPKYYYAGIASGYVNTGSWGSNSIGNSNYITTLRAGIRNVNDLYLGLVYLNGTENNKDSLVKNSNPKNQVLGIQFKYILFENHLIEGEKAWSNLYRQVQIQSLEEVKNTILTSKYNSSFYLKYSGTIQSTGTRLMALYRSDDPFYYSMGSPFNRKDFRKIEGNAEQKLFKNRLTTQVGYKNEADNISGIKISTTNIATKDLSLKYRKKNNNYKVSIRNISTNNSTIGTIADIYNINSVYSTIFKIKGIRNNLVFVYGYLYSNLKTLGQVSSNHYSTLNNTTFLGSKISINNQLAINIQGQSKDSSNSYNISSGISFEPYKTFNVTIRYAYTEIESLEQRHIIDNNLNYIFNQHFSLGINSEYHIIRHKIENKENFMSLQFNAIYLF